MLLFDTNRHDWLEDPGPRFTLMGLADDASSKVSTAHF